VNRGDDRSRVRGAQPLIRTDAGLLAAETPRWHMHVGALAIFGAADAATVLGPEQVRTLVVGRFRHLALFRRRLVERSGGLAWPVWEDAPGFDPGAHLRHATLEPPGGDRELDRTVGEIFGQPLDRSRPLWELWRIDGLRDGGLALLLKVHHACIDGLHGAAFASVIFDLTPDAPLERTAPDHEAPGPATSRSSAVRDAALALATTPLRAARLGLDVMAATPSLVRFGLSGARRAALLPFEAPPSAFNGHLTARRAFARASVSLTDVDAVRAHFGVSTNDVVLTLCSAAMRAYLARRDVIPERSLVAQLPVGVRGRDRHIDPDVVPGNLLSAMGAALPVQLDGPGDRLHAVQASTASARAMHQALGDQLLADLVAVPPPRLLAGLVRIYEILRLDTRLPPIYNALVSSVPGPAAPLYCGGAELTHAHLLGPLLVGGGLNVSVFRYRDTVDIGVVTCPDVVDDAHAIAEGFGPALAELVAAAGG
jgi:diacylglycerol O-acyltransferase / wax synthase